MSNLQHVLNQQVLPPTVSNLVPVRFHPHDCTKAALAHVTEAPTTMKSGDQFCSYFIWANTHLKLLVTAPWPCCIWLTEHPNPSQSLCRFLLFPPNTQQLDPPELSAFTVLFSILTPLVMSTSLKALNAITILKTPKCVAST